MYNILLIILALENIVPTETAGFIRVTAVINKYFLSNNFLFSAAFEKVVMFIIITNKKNKNIFLNFIIYFKSLKDLLPHIEAK